MFRHVINFLAHPRIAPLLVKTASQLSMNVLENCVSRNPKKKPLTISERTCATFNFSYKIRCDEQIELDLSTCTTQRMNENVKCRRLYLKRMPWSRTLSGPPSQSTIIYRSASYLLIYFSYPCLRSSVNVKRRQPTCFFIKIQSKSLSSFCVQQIHPFNAGKYRF